MAGILTKMVNENISLSTIFPDCDGGQGHTGNTGWGLFDQESHPGNVTWRPLTHAYAAFGELVQTTPNLLSVTVGPTRGAVEPAYTVLAGRSGGSGAAVKVLISSQVSNSTAIIVTPLE